MHIHIVTESSGHWVVLDDLADEVVVFDGTLVAGEAIELHDLQPIDQGFLIYRVVAFQPPYGLRRLHHVNDGGTLVLAR